MLARLTLTALSLSLALALPAMAQETLDLDTDIPDTPSLLEQGTDPAGALGNDEAGLGNDGTPQLSREGGIGTDAPNLLPQATGPIGDEQGVTTGNQSVVDQGIDDQEGIASGALGTDTAAPTVGAGPGLGSSASPSSGAVGGAVGN